MVNIGQLIKNKRLELGMTQEELAHKVGYKTKGSIQKLENTRDMPIKKLKPIAEALGIDVKVLLGWDDVEEEKAAPTLENADLLADIMHDPRLVEELKKVMQFDEKKKEALYSYIDFLSSN